jgi:hypothetical protein
MLLTHLELTKFLWSWFDFRKTQGIPLLGAKHEPSQNSHIPTLHLSRMGFLDTHDGISSNIGIKS